MHLKVVCVYIECICTHALLTIRFYCLNEWVLNEQSNLFFFSPLWEMKQLICSGASKIVLFRVQGVLFGGTKVHVSFSIAATIYNSAAKVFTVEFQFAGAQHIPAVAATAIYGWCLCPISISLFTRTRMSYKHFYNPKKDKYNTLAHTVMHMATCFSCLSCCVLFLFSIVS